MKTLHIIFDGPPDHDGPRFIECETATGRSIKAGEWRQRKDGYWSLDINIDYIKEMEL